MTYTGTFNFATYNAFKGLLHNPLNIRDNDRAKPGRMNSKIIVTYAIENIVSGMTYVGSTQCFFTRWRKHFGDLRNNRHSNQSLQDEFNSHGAEAYTIRILRSCENTDDLCLIEELDGKMNFKLKNLHNVRLGNTFINGNNNYFGDGTRTKRCTGKIVGRKHTRSRWFDGTSLAH